MRNLLAFDGLSRSPNTTSQHSVPRPLKLPLLVELAESLNTATAIASHSRHIPCHGFVTGHSNAAAIAGGLGFVIASYPQRIYAEALEPDLPAKKPIYSDIVVPTTPKPSSTSPVSEPNPTNPTPTDRLTKQVKRARLFVYDQSLAAENGINSLMSWAFKQETSFTNTIASLAPSVESGEQLLPGAIYVLVATLGGSIMTRNRGIFLRATFPLAVGITAGWILIPVTMGNIADLSWEYEKKVPFISNTHAQISGFTKEAWRQTKVHAKLATQWADETAGESRKKVEDWVEKGR